MSTDPSQFGIPESAASLGSRAASQTDDLIMSFQDQPIDQPDYDDLVPETDATALADEVIERLNETSEVLEDQAPVKEEDPIRPANEFTTDPTVDGDDGEESSIAQYMAGLLQRSHGESEIPVQPEKKPEEAPKPKVERKTIAPPERRDDLANMRELANFNARNAIETHSHKRLVGGASSYRAISVLAIIASFVLSTFATAILTVPFLGAICMFCIAILYAYRFMGATRALTRHEELDALASQSPPAS